jgi:hypothetical protein
MTSNITIENATVKFKNFSGKSSKYNPNGKRTFCVFIGSELANILSSDGWNIKHLEPRDPQDDPQAYLQVEARFDNFPPKVVLISSKGKTLLDEENVSILDWAEIDNIDLIIKPYNWIMNEGTKNETKGVKAFLKSIYVTITEDELERKYVDVPDNALSSLIEE